MDKQEKNTKLALIRASEAIRNKFKKLHNSESEQYIQNEKKFKPITNKMENLFSEKRINSAVEDIGDNRSENVDRSNESMVWDRTNSALQENRRENGNRSNESMAWDDYIENVPEENNESIEMLSVLDDINSSIFEENARSSTPIQPNLHLRSNIPIPTNQKRSRRNDSSAFLSPVSTKKNRHDEQQRCAANKNSVKRNQPEENSTFLKPGSKKPKNAVVDRHERAKRKWDMKNFIKKKINTKTDIQNMRKELLSNSKKNAKGNKVKKGKTDRGHNMWHMSDIEEANIDKEEKQKKRSENNYNSSSDDDYDPDTYFKRPKFAESDIDPVTHEQIVRKRNGIAFQGASRYTRSININAANDSKRKQLRPEEKLKKVDGSGLMQYLDVKKDYVYWDDPNELVDRLRLLIASTNAGHNGHRNEIISIIEELHEKNIIY